MGHQLVAVGTVNMKLTIVVSVFLMVAAVSYAATLAEESLDKKEANQILARQKRYYGSYSRGRGISTSIYSRATNKILKVECNCDYEQIHEEKSWLEDLEIKEEMKRRLELYKFKVKILSRPQPSL